MGVEFFEDFLLLADILFVPFFRVSPSNHMFLPLRMAVGIKLLSFCLAKIHILDFAWVQNRSDETAFIYEKGANFRERVKISRRHPTQALVHLVDFLRHDFPSFPPSLSLSWFFFLRLMENPGFWLVFPKTCSEINRVLEQAPVSMHILGKNKPFKALPRGVFVV
jgi:hypothetical protein